MLALSVSYLFQQLLGSAVRLHPLPRCRSNTADQLRSSIACAGFVSCIRLFDGAARPHLLTYDAGLTSTTTCCDSMIPVPATRRMAYVTVSLARAYANVIL